MSTTQTATDSTPERTDERARTTAIRHLTADITKAHAEGDAVAAQTLARALLTLVGEDAAVPPGIIDLAAERRKRP